MKTTILTLFMLLASLHVEGMPVEPVATTTAVAEDGGFFAGRKAQRKRNRRTKRINRRNGVGFLPMTQEVNHG